MTFANLKLPVDPGYAPEVTIEGSREYIEKGLAALGEDYVKMIRAAYEERWVDFAQNKGKIHRWLLRQPLRKEFVHFADMEQ